jgi:hypothetical protein
MAGSATSRIRSADPVAKAALDIRDHDLHDLASLVDYLSARQDLANLYSVLVQLVVAAIAIETAALVYFYTPGTPPDGKLTARILEYTIALSGLFLAYGLFHVRQRRRSLTSPGRRGVTDESIAATVEGTIALVDQTEVAVRFALLVPVVVSVIVGLIQLVYPSGFHAAFGWIIGA